MLLIYCASRGFATTEEFSQLPHKEAPSAGQIHDRTGRRGETRAARPRGARAALPTAIELLNTNKEHTA